MNKGNTILSLILEQFFAISPKLREIHQYYFTVLDCQKNLMAQSNENLCAVLLQQYMYLHITGEKVTQISRKM